MLLNSDVKQSQEAGRCGMATGMPANKGAQRQVRAVRYTVYICIQLSSGENNAPSMTSRNSVLVVVETDMLTKHGFAASGRRIMGFNCSLLRLISLTVAIAVDSVRATGLDLSSVQRVIGLESATFT